MKNKDAPKPRRRLTIPNILRVKWPNTSVAGTSPVASTSFYPGTQAPPLPMRPINVTQGYDSQSAADGRSASDAKDYQSPVYSANNVIIDGRNLDEEASWWDASVREINNRPGPGILPPVLADELHDPNHSLFSVSVTSPNLYVPLPSSSAPTHTPSSSQRPPPPTDDEVRTAIPHPNAYYCPKENGWVLLSWKSSSVPPPLARSFLSTAHHPLPDQNRRKRTGSCIGDVGQPFGQTNKTHHFHKYAKAVDAHKLTPPFRRDDWETLENVKAKRRAESIIMEVIDLEKMKAQEGDEMQEDEAGEEGKLLDLYVCCQCSFYCVASGVISGVIPCKFLEEFVRDRKSSPQPGKTGELAVVLALETLILIIQNKLWKGESRYLSVARPNFQQKIGWNQTIKHIFETLGFVEKTIGKGLTLRLPVTDPSTSQGRQNRAKLLRAWVEISAWIVDFRRIYGTQFKEHKGYCLSVKIDSVREMYQAAIGAHPEQIPRGELADPLMTALQPLQRAWRSLGLTPTTYSWELLAFGYFAQCRCDPAATINYFTHFFSLIKIMQDLGGCPQQLQDITVMERLRDRYTCEDIDTASHVLGFGSDGPLKVEFDNDIPGEFIEKAWRECVKRSWRDHDGGQNLQRDANEAFRILAEVMGSVRLRKIWEAGKDKLMNPDQPYDTLEVPKDLDDSMLIPVFSMRLEEQPLQIDKMREALFVIAEIRDSERLRQFLSTGQDVLGFGSAVPPENWISVISGFHDILADFITPVSVVEAPADWIDASRKHVLAALQLVGISCEEYARFSQVTLRIYPPLSISWFTPLCMSSFAQEIHGASKPKRKNLWSFKPSFASRIAGVLQAELSKWNEYDDLTQLLNHHSISHTLCDILSQCGKYSHSCSAGAHSERLVNLDNTSVAAHILLILCDSEHKKLFLAQRESQAQILLDLLQKLLDSASLDPRLHPPIVSAIVKLSKKSGLYPQCLILRGVQKLGQDAVAGGSFGDIWKGEVDGHIIAIKVMRTFGASDVTRFLKAFSYEAVLWRQLSHPNLLPFCGVYHWSDDRSRICLVSPWMMNGNILQYLEQSPHADRVSLLSDVALGLQYLHSRKPSVIHGDLKGANILILPSLQACITDFGLATLANDSKFLTSSSSTASAGGSLRCQAPELLDYAGDGMDTHKRNSMASDIYAFACVCYEIFVGHPPFHELTPAYRVISAVVNGNRPPRPSLELYTARGLDDAIWDLIDKCWGMVPAQRPSASDVVQSLSSRSTPGGKPPPTRGWDEGIISCLRSTLAGHPWSGPTCPPEVAQGLDNHQSRG